jgi:preprotein translocase subunit YajC
MLALWYILAQAGGGGGGGGFNPFDLVLPLGLAFLFYFVLLRPMRRQEAERKSLLGSLKKNDKILTASGIYGTVVDISDDKDEITVKVADNVRVKMTKGSIARNLSNEEAALEAKKAKEEATAAK